MARTKWTESSAEKELERRCSAVAILEGLLSADMDMPWLCEQLKTMAAEKSTPAQYQALKVGMQLMACGGQLARVDMASEKPTAKSSSLARDVPDPMKPTRSIDEIVGESLRQETKDAEPGDDGQQE